MLQSPLNMIEQMKIDDICLSLFVAFYLWHSQLCKIERDTKSINKLLVAWTYSDDDIVQSIVM